MEGIVTFLIPPLHFNSSLYVKKIRGLIGQINHSKSMFPKQHGIVPHVDSELRGSPRVQDNTHHI